MGMPQDCVGCRAYPVGIHRVQSEVQIVWSALSLAEQRADATTLQQSISTVPSQGHRIQ